MIIIRTPYRVSFFRRGDRLSGMDSGASRSGTGDGDRQVLLGDGALAAAVL